MPPEEHTQAPREAPPLDAAGSALPAPPAPRPGILSRVGEAIHYYFVGEDLSFGILVVPLCFLAMVLYTRHPMKTNFIFDEQEALLANPYVRSVAEPNLHLGWLDAFRRPAGTRCGRSN